MLTHDFNIKTINDNTKFIITGDFNDGYGHLMNDLSKEGITIFNRKVMFEFGKRTSQQKTQYVKTCCPNRNSSKLENVETLENVKTPVHERIPLNAPVLEYFSNTPTKLSDDQKTFVKEYVDPEHNNIVDDHKNYAFFGDNVGISNNSKKRVDISIIDKPQTSDHLFVHGHFANHINGGKRKTRRTRRTRKSKRAKKARKTNTRRKRRTRR